MTFLLSPTSSVLTTRENQPNIIRPSSLHATARKVVVEIPVHNQHVHQPLSSSHGCLPTIRGVQSAGGAHANELTLQELKVVARGRLREVRCCWGHGPGEKGCDAILASYNLFRKHVKRHYAKAETDAVTRVEPGSVVPILRCGWCRCHWSTRDGVTRLDLHVQKEHLRELQETFCPVKDCHDGEVSVEEYRSAAHYNPIDHPHPWTLDSLYPEPLRVHTNPRNLVAPPPLPLNATIDPFLAHAEPYRGTEPGLNKSRRSRFACSPPPPLTELGESITPLQIHRDDFFVVAGDDAPIGIFHSHVFFPHPDTNLPGRTLHRDDGLRIKLGDKWVEHGCIRRLMRKFPPPRMKSLQGKNDVEGESSPLDELAPPGACDCSAVSMIPRPRPDPSYARVRPSRGYFDALATWRQSSKRKAAQMSRSEAVKSDTISDLSPTTSVRPPSAVGTTLTDAEGTMAGLSHPLTQETEGPERYDRKRVVRAALVHAQKKAKRSYGFDVWAEKVRFIKRGHELGECQVEF